MLNWWEANQFRMPAVQGGRYKPSLIDYPGMTPPEAKPQAAPALFTRNDFGDSGIDDGSMSLSGGTPVGQSAAATQGQATGRMSSANPSMGKVGGTVGTLAGLAAGIPGAGLVGSAIGTAMDTSRANRDMEAIGLDPALSGLSAWGGGLGFGLGEKAGLGKSLDTQSFGLTGLTTQGLSDLARTGFNTSMGLNDVVKGMADLEAPNTAGAGRGGWGGLSANDIATSAGVYGGLSQPGYADPGLAAAAQAAARAEAAGQSTGTTDSGLSSDGLGGTGEGYDGPWNKGGILPRKRDTVAGPDDQRITAKSGEGIIRAEAVEHYGPGLIGAINKMRIPKKKLQGLLGARP